MKSLPQIIDALETSEDEFKFHAQRLRGTDAQTEDESGHLVSLSQMYAQAARAARLLRRYQEGRLRNGKADPAQTEAVDERGVARAFVG